MGENGNPEIKLTEKDLRWMHNFNWGAFLLAPLWCFVYKRYILGVVIITLISIIKSIISYPGLTIILFAVGLALHIYVGITANKHLWEKCKDKYTTMQGMINSQMKWEYWGIAIEMALLILISWYW